MNILALDQGTTSSRAIVFGAGGAAYLAGLAVGVWASREEIAAHWARERSFAPVMSRESAAARMAEWRRAVRSALTFAE